MAFGRFSFKKLIDRSIRSIRYYWIIISRRGRVNDVIFVTSRRELPKDLRASLFIVGTNPAQWAVLNCPCGCRERANLKLGAATRTSWSLTVSSGKASLAPSVLMPGGRCASHFFIRANRIIWVCD